MKALFLAEFHCELKGEGQMTKENFHKNTPGQGGGIATK